MYLQEFLKYIYSEMVLLFFSAIIDAVLKYLTIFMKFQSEGM